MFKADTNENMEFLSGERLYAPYEKLPTDKTGDIQEHLERYKFVLNFLQGDEIVVDAACGSGYGSEILSKKAEKVIGLEISEHALNYADKYHKKNNIEFQKTDLNNFIDLPDNFCDLIASFETLEHVSFQEKALLEFQRILKPGGLLIISTPDKDLVSDGKISSNPFHVKELTKKDFLFLLGQYFTVEELYGQLRVILLPFWKKLIKNLRRFSFFKKIKDKFVMKNTTLKKFLNRSFASNRRTPIIKTAISAPGEFRILIGICRKNKFL